MRLKCQYKTRFFLQTIKSLLLSVLSRRKLERLVIKQLKIHFSHYEYVLTSSGRSALALLFESIKNNPGKSCDIVLLPDYICNVVYEAARFGGLKISIYRTDNNYKPVIADICKKIVSGRCCVLLASILGRINNSPEIVKQIREFDPCCTIIYDECQNLIGARNIVLDKNSHLVLSFNNKMTPGLLGGVVVSTDNNHILKFWRKYKGKGRKYNAIMALTYLRQNLRILSYAIKERYPLPGEMDYSSCQGKYSVTPAPISSISLAAAYTALMHGTFHHEMLIKNNEVMRELQEKGIILIQGKPDTNDAPYIPVINYYSDGCLPMKGRYGTPAHPPKVGTENCLILSNSLLYELEM